jgi:excisionase family DNA binding protein
MKLYTANELAEILQIHPKTVYRLGREGKLKLVRVGRSVRFYEPKSERKG